MNLTLLVDQFHPIEGPIDKACVIYYDLVYTLGFFLNALLLILWWRHRKEDIDQFAIFIIITDCINGISCFTFWQLSYRMDWMESGVGPVGCIFAGTLSYTTTITTMFSLFLYAYQRYLIISRKNPLQLRKAAVLYIACILLTSFFISFPAIMGESPGYDLGPSGSYCMINWSQRSPASLVVVVYTTIATCGTIMGVVLVYMRILSILYESSKKIAGIGKSSSTTGGGPPSSQTSQQCFDIIRQENLDRQRILVKRVVMMVIVNVCSFTPYTLCIIYELVSGNRVSPIIDAIATVTFVSNMCFDFFLFITINSFYRELFWGLFGVSLKEKKATPS